MKKYNYSELVEICETYQFKRVYFDGRNHLLIRDSKGHVCLRNSLIPLCESFLSYMRENASPKCLECVWNCVFSDFTKDTLKQWLIVLVKDFVVFFIDDDNPCREILRPFLYELIVEFNRSAPDSFVEVKRCTITVDVRIVFDRNNNVVGYVWIDNPFVLYRSLGALKSVVSEHYKGYYANDAIIYNIL